MSVLDKLKFWEKSKEEQEDVSIVDEFKEPFSFQTFWDDHVVGRWLTIRQFLKEKGILFFLMSPFQYKNRLILKLVLIVFGVFVGIVPRSMNLIDAARERNEGSQFANAESALRVGDHMEVEPLLASQYEQTHILAFDIIGATSDGVPSTTEGFNVDLSANRGVMYPEDVSYRYRVLPVSSNSRLLLVYIDTSEQDNESGVYNLDIHAAHDEPMHSPFEIVISDLQETTAIYGENGINLSVLSSYMTGLDDDDTRITDAEDELDHLLSVYSNNEDRLNAMGMQLGFTTEDALTYVGSHLILNDVFDTSTTHDIEDISPQEEQNPSEVVSTIVYNDRTFRDDEDLEEDDVREYRSVAEELRELTTMVNEIQTGIQNVNRARMQKFDELDRVANTLNQEISIDTFSEPQGIED